MTEETETYEDIAGYAKVYLGLWYAEDDWKDILNDLAEDLVIERIILYYIMRAEGLTPDEQTLAVKVDEVKKEYMDEYIYQYLLDYDENRAEFEDSNIQKNKEYAAKMNKIIKAWKDGDFENEDYAAFYAERENEMFTYYGEAYFVETAYYEIVVDEMVKWPEVTTFDIVAIK